LIGGDKKTGHPTTSALLTGGKQQDTNGIMYAPSPLVLYPKSESKENGYFSIIKSGSYDDFPWY
jgi:hypothetical protein